MVFWQAGWIIRRNSSHFSLVTNLMAHDYSYLARGIQCVLRHDESSCVGLDTMIEQGSDAREPDIILKSDGEPVSSASSKDHCHTRAWHGKPAM
jgi:hypothetical protein